MYPTQISKTTKKMFDKFLNVAYYTKKKSKYF